MPEPSVTSLHSQQALQSAYYRRTASQYDDLHLHEPEHNVALRYISTLIAGLGINRMLDVGCGTGRSFAELQAFNPALEIFGVEPVRELLDMALAKGVLPSSLIGGSGYSLPFPDGTFGASMALGVLHHVKQPELVIKEMVRVSQRAIFISDSNLFGQGAAWVRILKFMLYKAGLWGLAKRVQTRGRGYLLSETDGLAYSYSIFFQYNMLRKWAGRVFTIPTCDMRESQWLLEPFSHRSVLLCAIRD
jgi:ubiquinone/menaquinone biosynthesis C-methylase UbiE